MYDCQSHVTSTQLPDSLLYYYQQQRRNARQQSEGEDEENNNSEEDGMGNEENPITAPSENNRQNQPNPNTPNRNTPTHAPKPRIEPVEI